MRTSPRREPSSIRSPKKPLVIDAGILLYDYAGSLLKIGDYVIHQGTSYKSLTVDRVERLTSKMVVLHHAPHHLYPAQMIKIPTQKGQDLLEELERDARFDYVESISYDTDGQPFGHKD